MNDRQALTPGKRFLSPRRRSNPRPFDDRWDALTIELLRLRWRAKVQVAVWGSEIVFLRLELVESLSIILDISKLSYLRHIYIKWNDKFTFACGKLQRADYVGGYLVENDWFVYLPWDEMNRQSAHFHQLMFVASAWYLSMLILLLRYFIHLCWASFWGAASKLNTMPRLLP